MLGLHKVHKSTYTYYRYIQTIVHEIKNMNLSSWGGFLKSILVILISCGLP